MTRAGAAGMLAGALAVLGAAALAWGAGQAQADCVPGLLQQCPSTTPTSAPSGGQPGLPPLPLPTTTTTAPPPPPADLAAAERRLLELLNGERAARGLPPLARRAQIDDIAARWSRQMAAAGSLSHNDDYFTKAVKDLLGASLVGENVAKNESVEDMHRRLMASPHHRDNILDRRFTQVGVGMAQASNGMLYATQDFATPRAPAAPAPAPKRPAAAAPAAPSTPAPPVGGPEPVEPVVPADGMELALPGPMDMAGVAVGAVGSGEGRGRSGWVLGWGFLALVALGSAVRRIAAPFAVGIDRYHSA